MIETSRRNFLFGMAAALAVASVPSILRPTLVAVPHKFKLRKIRDISIYFETPAVPSVATIEIGRLGDSAWFLHFGMTTRSHAHWRAWPNEEIVMLPEQLLEVNVGSADVATVDMTCADTIDEGPPVLVHERFDSKNGPPKLTFVHVDNSLEARLERAKVISHGGCNDL